MKNYRIQALTLAFVLVTGITNAQQSSLAPAHTASKPELFTQLPSRIPVAATDLETLISSNTETGKDASLAIAGKNAATFAGQVVSTASQHDNSVRSIVIRSSYFNGASFSLTAVTGDDGNTRYRGRIVSFKHGDVYELELNDNQYVLVKKDIRRLLQD